MICPLCDFRFVDAAFTCDRKETGSISYRIEFSRSLEDISRAHASGDEVRTAIAGYCWFADWRRATMISIKGLALTTGCQADASALYQPENPDATDSSH